MKKTFFLLTAFLLSFEVTFASIINREDIGFDNKAPDGSIIDANGVTLIGVLTLIQSILLNLVLPVIVVGSGLYIAYQLLTAEGDETRMKKAWKSVTFTAIALLVVAFSYAAVTIVSSISL